MCFSLAHIDIVGWQNIIDVREEIAPRRFLSLWSRLQDMLSTGFSQIAHRTTPAADSYRRREATVRRRRLVERWTSPRSTGWAIMQPAFRTLCILSARFIEGADRTGRLISPGSRCSTCFE
jgi:hypothetical protein